MIFLRLLTIAFLGLFAWAGLAGAQSFQRHRPSPLPQTQTDATAAATVLKSWIDYVVRPGFTFRLAPGWPGCSKTADLVTPVLRKVLDFIGIRDVDVVRAGGSLAVNLGKARSHDHLRTCPAAAA